MPHRQMKLAGGVGGRGIHKSPEGSIIIIKFQESYLEQKTSICHNVEKMEPCHAVGEGM